IVLECPMIARRCFQLVLIKPSHYDDDGYVIRWWRAMIRSNSLAAVYAIAADCAERLVLGPDVAIDLEAIDETNTRIDVPTLVARFPRRYRIFLPDSAAWFGGSSDPLEEGYSDGTGAQCI